jgi:hypothetical protein
MICFNPEYPLLPRKSRIYDLQIARLRPLQKVVGVFVPSKIEAP